MKLKIYLVLSVCLGFLTNSKSNAQLTGVVNIPGGYPTLLSAVTALNQQGVGTGGVVINVLANQTAPTGGYLLGSAVLNASTSPGNPVTINGNNNTITANIGTSTSSDGIFFIQGTDNVTVNGLNLQENALNTTTTTAMEWGYALVNLNSAAPFDGCKNDVITNCTIKLNRAIATPSVGIYVGHNQATSNSQLPITDTADLNSYNKFYSNNISNVANGIWLAGYSGAASPYTLYDQGNDVGGNSAATGNTITNFGGNLIASGVGGVAALYQNNSNVSYNNMNDTANGGVVTTGIVWGVQIIGQNAQFTVTNNNMTLIHAPSVYSSYLYGIWFPNTASAISTTSLRAAKNRITMNLNTTTTYCYMYGISYRYAGKFACDSNYIGMTTSGTANYGYGYGIYSYYNSGSTLSITSDSLSVVNSSVAYFGSVYPMYIYGSTTALSTSANISNNYLTGSLVTNSYCYGMYYYTPSGNITISGNKIANITRTGTGSVYIYGIYGYTGIYTTPGTLVNVSNNEISNINNNIGSGTLYPIYAGGGYVTNIYNNNIFNNTSYSIYGLTDYYYANTMNVYNNNIYNLTGTGGSIYSMYVYGYTVATQNFYNNYIHDITNSGSITTGAYIYYSGSSSNAVLNFNNNKITDLTTTSSSGMVSGIYNGYTYYGGVHNYFNNVIGNLKAPASTNGAAVAALYSVPSTSSSYTNAIKFYDNTVYLSGTSTGSGFGTSAVYDNTTANMSLSGNIFVNSTVPTGSGLAAGYRRTSSTITNYNTASNNNSYYIGTPSATNVMYYDGTTSYQTLATFQAGVTPRESASLSVNPNFLSTTGSNANFLHIDATIPTVLESANLNYPGITTDIDNQPRQGNPGYVGPGTAPDMGADEFSGRRPTGPYFTATTTAPSGNACTAIAHTVTTTIVANTAAVNVPVLTYTIGTNTPVNVNMTLSSGTAAGTSVWTATIPAAVPVTASVSWSIAVTDGTYNNMYTGPTYADAPLLGATATASVSVASVCANGPTALSATLVGPATPTTVNWYAGTTLVGTGNPLTVNPPAATTYYGVMVDTNGCTVTTPNVAVTTLAAPVTPTVTATGSTAVCNGNTVALSVPANASNIYQWYLNNVAIYGAVTNTYAANLTGNYTAMSTLPLSGCSLTSTTPMAVTINPKPSTAITPASTLTFCTGSVVLQAPAGAYSYVWKLNGTANGVTSANDTATASGAYTVKVTNTVTGCVDSTSSPVTVTTGSAPPASIYPVGPSKISACNNGSVLLFVPTAANGLTYQWFKNDTLIAGATSSSYLATTVGVYRDSVSAGTGCSSGSAADTIIYTTPPAVSMTPAGQSVMCANGLTTFTANTASGNSFQWNLNGIVIPGATNVTYVASAPGRYSVSVKSPANACINTSNEDTLTVNPLPAAVISAASATSFCAGSSVKLYLNKTTGYAYSWNLNGSTIPNATDTAFVASASGAYAVVVTNTATGCSFVSADSIVTVTPYPVISISPTGPINLCTGSTINLAYTGNLTTGYNYQWKNGTNNVGTATSYLANAAGAYRLVVTANGCTTTSDSAKITMLALPSSKIKPTGSITACDSVMLYRDTVGNGLSYQWNFNGAAIGGATDTVYRATATGSYTITTSNGVCAQASPATTVTINTTPSAQVTNTSPLSFCAGGAVVLNVNQSTGFTYQWYLNGTALTGATTSTYVSSNSGIYTVKVINPSGGCNRTSSNTVVTVNPVPAPVINYAPLPAPGVLSTTAGYTSYQWMYETFPISGANGLSTTATVNGAYTVVVVDANGCSGTSAIKYVTDVPTGVNATIAKNIRVFPNPTTGMVYITSSFDLKIEVRDVNGKIVLSYDKTKEVNLANIADGMYFMYINTTDGQFIKTEKVMKTTL